MKNAAGISTDLSGNKMQGEDFWLMVVCCMTAGLIALLLVLTANAEPQAHDLGWLAQKQIQARQDCAELIKYRMQ